jgi:hypothetical protein
MNIFKSIYIIVKAFNDRYLTSKQDELNQKLHASALITERRNKTALQSQIEEIVVLLKRKPEIHAVKVEINEECIPYIDETLKTAECELTPLGNNQYLIELDEAELC